MGKRRRTIHAPPNKGLGSVKNKVQACSKPPIVPTPSEPDTTATNGPKGGCQSEESDPSLGWTKPPGLSEKFDLLMRKGPGGLTIAQLNVKKLGRAKRKELAATLATLKIDCLAIVEHHIEAGDYEVDKYSTRNNCKSLSIKGFNHASKHRDKKSGGVAWYWKKGLNAEVWEGANLPADLKEAGRERCWIKIRCKTNTVALGVAYMPCESSNDSQGEQYEKILNVLSLDSDQLKEEGISDFLFGDFNAHVGTPTEDPLGIKGNKGALGHNGVRLLDWLRSRNKVLVNSQEITKGLWTYQSPDGSIRSALDFMICNQKDLPQTQGLIIDEDREVTSINNDHNLIISVLNIDYQKVEWQKTKRPKWDVKAIKRKAFKTTLERKITSLENLRKGAGTDNSLTNVLADVTESVEAALKASTSKITAKSHKQSLSSEVLELINKIKNAEGERSALIKKQRTLNLPEEGHCKSKINELTDLIKNLRVQKEELILSEIKNKKDKTRRVLKSKGQRSKAFWREAKPHEEETINSFRTKNGTQTTTQEESMSRVKEHFEDLFTARERPTTGETIPIPQVKRTKYLTKPFKVAQIRKKLQKLQTEKATGPDGIPNEALKIGASILARHLQKAFNLILLLGESPPAWAEGLMYLVYKGKGDMTDLNNYRGVTVNNAISKVFTSLLNERLLDIAERSGILGEIQNGGRKGRQGLDSLFTLLTILEKSAGSGATSHKDLSLLFVDLSKAYDKVPHDLLWEKLSRMGFHPQFIKVLKSLYKDSSVTVLVNGHQSDKVHVNSGVKQGCPLSPLLFSLFLSDVGHYLEHHPAGVLIWGKIISALFFVDDLVLIGKNQKEVENLLEKCQSQFEANGMEINCSKCNILSSQDVLNNKVSLLNTSGVILGEISLKDKYKYLGIQVGLGRASDIFRFHRNTLVSRIKSFAGLILPMARDSHDPIEVGEALWKSVALESILYGIQIVSVTNLILNKLDSVQASFAADLLGVGRSTSHAGILREMGWTPISCMVMKRKLLYWSRLYSLDNELWAKKALLESMAAKHPHGGAWRSDYRKETETFFSTCKIGNLLKDDRSPEANIRLAVDRYERETMAENMRNQRSHSLKYLPEYPDGMGRQKYINHSESSSALAKFRLGNANLGNRETPRILICPSCGVGPNNENHLVFECTAMSELRMYMNHILEEATDQQRFPVSDNRKLQSFLGGDLASSATLLKRGMYLSILRDKHLELKNGAKP